MTAPKVYHLTEQDRRRWKRLIRLALEAAALPTGAAGDLLNAARAAAKAVAPDSDSLRLIFSPLIRLAELWPAMGGHARALNADRLAWLARAAEQKLELPPLTVAGAPEAEPEPPRLPFRADLDG